MEKQHSGRSSFSGKLGFVLSAAGASVGLGNIWRFPYLAAKYGRGIFLLIYIVLALTFGYSMIVAEPAGCTVSVQYSDPCRTEPSRVPPRGIADCNVPESKQIWPSRSYPQYNLLLPAAMRSS